MAQKRDHQHTTALSYYLICRPCDLKYRDDFKVYAQASVIDP